MISSIICKNCDGFGCEECNYVGWQIYNDADGSLYYAQIENGKVSVGGSIPTTNVWQKIWKSLFSTPHDLFWAIDKINRAKNYKKY